MQHLPFILSIGILLSVIGILYFRKWILNKHKGFEELIAEKTALVYMLIMFHRSKSDEQDQLFYNAIRNLSKDTIRVNKVKITESEMVLFKRLQEYEKDKENFILNLLNKDFEDENNNNNKQNK